MANPGIGDRIKFWIERLAEAWKEAVGSWIGFQAEDIIVSADELELPPSPSIDRDMTLKALKGEMGLEDWISWVSWHDNHPSLSDRGTRILTSALSYLAWVVGVSSPSMRIAGYEVDKTLHSARLDPATAFIAWKRDGLSGRSMETQLAEQGFSPENIGAILSALYTYPGDAELLASWLRGDLSEAELNTKLVGKGYRSDDIMTLKGLARLIPGPADLVRMAVREAWRDDYADEWKLDEDRPPEFVEWMAKQGFSFEWAMRYWRAHWDLPSLMMAREMVFRTDYTEDNYKDLLRAADIPRGYRDFLTQIIYNYYTRVDIRRMNAMGVIPDEDLTEVYMNYGYNRERAEHMTEFTIRYNTDEEREATKSDIIGALTDDLVYPEEAKELLQTIDYPEWLADIFVARAQLAKSKSLLAERMRQVKTLYINYELDAAGVHAELGALNLPAIRIERLLEEWDIRRRAMVARPSVSKLEGYFYNDIIPQEEFVEQMHYHKYPEVYIQWSLEDIFRKKREAAEKEEERARKERERIREWELKTDRDEALAEIAVEIAVWKVAIADLQLATLSVTEPEELEEIAEAILIIKVEIAHLQEGKARIRLEYLEERRGS